MKNTKFLILLPLLTLGLTACGVFSDSLSGDAARNISGTAENYNGTRTFLEAKAGNSKIGSGSLKQTEPLTFSWTLPFQTFCSSLFLLALANFAPKLTCRLWKRNLSLLARLALQAATHYCYKATGIRAKKCRGRKRLFKLSVCILTVT